MNILKRSANVEMETALNARTTMQRAREQVRQERDDLTALQESTRAALNEALTSQVLGEPTDVRAAEKEHTRAGDALRKAEATVQGIESRIAKHEPVTAAACRAVLTEGEEASFLLDQELSEAIHLEIAGPVRSAALRILARADAHGLTRIADAIRGIRILNPENPYSIRDADHNLCDFVASVWNPDLGGYMPSAAWKSDPEAVQLFEVEKQKLARFELAKRTLASMGQLDGPQKVRALTPLEASDYERRVIEDSRMSA